MGRKKTIKVEEQPKTEEVTNQNPSNNTINIGYTGTVTISICDNKNNIISTKKHHNEGSTKLFEYFCHCIAGAYPKAEAMQPRKIMLITRYGNTEISTVKSKFNSGNQEISNIIELSCSGAVSTYGTIVPEQITVTNDSKTIKLRPWKTTLHFRIPYAYITKNKISGLVLFPENTPTVTTANLTTDWQAYYLLTTNDESWAELEINSGQNYNLLVDWELSISNNMTTTTNS